MLRDILICRIDENTPFVEIKYECAEGEHDLEVVDLAKHVRPIVRDDERRHVVGVVPVGLHQQQGLDDQKDRVSEEGRECESNTNDGQEHRDVCKLHQIEHPIYKIRREEK